MNDRFKFRVWCMACNGYVSPTVLTIDDDGYISKGHMDTEDGYGHNASMTIEQCTNKRSISGWLLFEGDIIKWDGRYGLVYWCHHNYYAVQCYANMHPCSIPNNFDIVGNIHEDIPEFKEQFNMFTVTPKDN